MSKSPSVSEVWRIVRASEYTGNPEDTQIQSIIEGADGRTVLWTDSGYYRPLEADAVLIAKAPELLKALREIAALQPEGVVDEWSEAREFHHAQEIAARALVDLGDV